MNDTSSPDKQYSPKPQTSGFSHLMKWLNYGFFLSLLIINFLLYYRFSSQISQATMKTDMLTAAFTEKQSDSLTDQQKIQTWGSDIKQLKQLQQDNVNSVQKIKPEIDALQKLLDEIKTVQSGQNDQISVLDTRISVIEKQTKDSVTTVAAVTTTKNQGGKTPVKSARKVKNDKSAENLPFILTTTELRGGQWYAVVVPRTSPQLSSMRLLAPTDNFNSWVLLAASSTSATFHHKGSKGGSLTLKVEEAK